MQDFDGKDDACNNIRVVCKFWSCDCFKTSSIFIVYSTSIFCYNQI